MQGPDVPLLDSQPINEIRAITLDFYGTLATHGTCDEIYGQYTSLSSVAVDLFRTRFNEEMNRHFDWVADRAVHELQSFPTIRSMYHQVFIDLFTEFRIPADVESATEALMHFVGRPQLFPETLSALDRLSRFNLCLVTDADDDMIQAALHHTQLPIRHVVTSHSLRSYKASKNSPLFERALELLNARPEETVHIGDRLPDVLGARRSGIRVIWVQRDGNLLPDKSPRPDAIVRDLNEAALLLERGWGITR